MTRAADRIEDLRVAWERDLERMFAAQPRGLYPAAVDPGARDPRVRLERAIAERVHRVARDAAERLGCTEPFVLYQTPRERGHLSAQALRTERPFAIRLIGPVASVLDDAGLAVLIGHELGHWMALGPPSLLLEAWERGASAHIKRLCILASEITADRFALIAARGELEAAVRLDVAIATFDSPRALGLRELDYLEELRQRIERREDDLIVESTGYPTTAFRLYATWLFWRSDLHRDLTGAGPGDLALGEVDATLKAICTDRLSWPPAAERHPARGPQATARVSAAPEAPDALAATPDAARPAGVALGRQIRAAASSVASTLGRFIDGIDTDGESATEPASVLDEVDDVDDVERRFRELEAGSVGDAPASRPTHIEDLEARFRELEERERNAR